MAADYNGVIHLQRPCPFLVSPSPAEPASYEEALAELDRLLQAMEGGQLPLDKLLESYQRGSQLLTFCRGRLKAVEDQIQVLEEGQLKPWTSE
jgi:exodeoxyribonuclease VII small subunit